MNVAPSPSPAVLLRPVAARLRRTPRVWVPVVAWLGLGLAVAAVSRAQGAPNGADHALSGAFGAVVLPLLAYSVVGGALGARSLASSASPVASFGAPRALFAALTVAFAALVTALLAAGLGATVAMLAHGVDDPPRTADALATAYVGALGGASYAAFFAFGAAFGRRGGGRPVLLVADWLLGAMGGPLAALSPRGHVASLLGGPPCASLSGRASAVLLVVLALAWTSLAVARVRRS